MAYVRTLRRRSRKRSDASFLAEISRVATVRILVDTDVFTDYFNAGQHARILDARQTMDKRLPLMTRNW